MKKDEFSLTLCILDVQFQCGNNLLFSLGKYNNIFLLHIKPRVESNVIQRCQVSKGGLGRCGGGSTELVVDIINHDELCLYRLCSCLSQLQNDNYHLVMFMVCLEQIKKKVSKWVFIRFNRHPKPTKVILSLFSMQGMKRMFMNRMDMNKRMMNIFIMLNLTKMKGIIMMFYRFR